MRLMTIIGLIAVVAAAGSAGAQSPQQYAVGTVWETSLAGSPEVALLGAAAIAATGGNLYLLQGNTLRKISNDMTEIASVQLPDLTQAVASIEDTRFEITCGMQGSDLSVPAAGPPTAALYDNSGATNRLGTAAPASSGEQDVNHNMVQGLHQAHALNALSRVQLAADQYGVYLLRGGRLTIFDHNLREARSKDMIIPVSAAADCPLCAEMLSNGTVMDQVRFRGMRDGLCPGPGLYRYGVGPSDSTGPEPTATGQSWQVPASLGTTTAAPGTAASTSSPGAAMSTGTTATSDYGPAAAGSLQHQQAAAAAAAPPPGTAGGGGVATTPGTIGTRHTGTAATAAGVTAVQGAPGATPGSVGTASAGTATAGVGTRALQQPGGTTPGSTGTAAGGTATSGAATQSGLSVLQPTAGFGTLPPASGTGFGTIQTSAGSADSTMMSNPPAEVPTGLTAEIQPARNEQYRWMWELPDMVPGAVSPVALRDVQGGNVFLGVSGSQDLGPQYLHVSVRRLDGSLDPQAQVIRAYLYQRGEAEGGRTLALQRHAPGEYWIRFQPGNMRGDTLAIRLSRPGHGEEVVYFPLTAPEPVSLR